MADRSRPAAPRKLAERLALDAGIDLPAPVTSGVRVEVVRRGGALFVINHGQDDAKVLIDGTDALTGAPTSGMRLPRRESP
ncbi:hypothetical protein E3O42_14000 [Cryobacterium adonitolivorans]|uniref:Beta-galactosidase C-terminal domain-containing protein n=1 Tax=Cryobacterium adonitolivorans TaxID=1259189 RepID=A0A4R8VZQ6_9MICO|nr:hypothetical protein [Cryobacterium adonitolivorans]TFB99349.1 hypothetical protein E3O42_14000 [Cryobacterium adonitolivorans]